MRASFTLGKVFGIPIRINYTCNLSCTVKTEVVVKMGLVLDNQFLAYLNITRNIKLVLRMDCANTDTVIGGINVKILDANG